MVTRAVQSTTQVTSGRARSQSIIAEMVLTEARPSHSAGSSDWRATSAREAAFTLKGNAWTWLGSRS